MNIAKLGVYAVVDVLTAAESAAFAQRVEQWGYGALWIPEAFGCDPLTRSSWLLANTKTLNIATGIANIYARDSLATLNAQHGLAEQSGGRFLLGIGVSHVPLVEGIRGHTYEKPITAMTSYLQAMTRTRFGGPPPTEKPKTVIAALGPRMLEVAAQYADGAHPYNVTPEHTERARSILGPDKLLCPEQMVLLEKSPSEARAIGRKMLGRYLALPNYRNNFLRMGFSERDLDNDGSDRFIDALIVWGDEKDIRARIQQHWDAGADHVCIQAVPRAGIGMSSNEYEVLQLLAPG